MAIGVIGKLGSWGNWFFSRCDIYNNGDLLYQFFVRMQEVFEDEEKIRFKTSVK